MSKTAKNIDSYILSWEDSNKKIIRKEFVDYSKLMEARKWLISNNATNVDVRVVLKNKQTADVFPS